MCDDCGFMLAMKRIVGVTASSRRCRPSLGEWRKVKAALWTRSSHRKRRCSSYTVSAEKKKTTAGDTSSPPIPFTAPYFYFLVP